MHQRVSGWIFVMTLALLAVVLPARAQLAVGRDYVPIVPAQTSDHPAKIEVIEFFSYGCPHCSDFHPVRSASGQRRYPETWFSFACRSPSGVPSGRVSPSSTMLWKPPAIWPDLMAPSSKPCTGKGSKLYDDRSVADWVKAQGVDGKKFADAYSSFGVVSKVKRADQMAQAYKIQGVPALAVDGKYLVLGKEIKGLPDLVLLTDQVIQLARSERKARGDRGKK